MNYHSHEFESVLLSSVVRIVFTNGSSQGDRWPACTILY